MDKNIRQLLGLLSAAMETKEDAIDLEDADWVRLFEMAGSHNVIPMIYHALQKTGKINLVKPNLADVWEKMAFNICLAQIYRTLEFLSVYERFNKENILALAVKGIICRSLYPDRSYRSSGDEDVYIRKADFEKADCVLNSAGFLLKKDIGWEDAQVKVYDSSSTGLTIELHTDLFDPQSEIFGPLNGLFQSAFDNSISIRIEKTLVHTLPHNLHLLFLILHCLKHFMSVGVGIRQVCDIVMYCNTYGSEIEWEFIWRQLTDLKYEVFLLNLLDIGSRYLGLNKSMIKYPIMWSASDIHSDALLEDMISSGIFGKSTLARSKTGSISANAVLMDKKQKSKGVNKKRVLIWKALFPGSELLKSHYPYSRKSPLLVPVAWLNRIAVYIKATGNPFRAVNTTCSTISIGRQRIELFKEYRIINRT